LKKESEIVEHFEKIIGELGKGPFDPFLEANFLVYSGVFGVLRRWILKPRYSREEIIDYLVQSQIQEVIRRVQRKTVRSNLVRSSEEEKC